MKKLLILAVTLLTLASHAHAQDNEQPGLDLATQTYDYFDSAWKSVSEKKAVYLCRLRQTVDSCWQYSYYTMLGPIIRIESFKMGGGSVRHGMYAWYDSTGRLDSAGRFVHGKKEGEWIYPGLTPDKNSLSGQLYEQGRLIANVVTIDSSSLTRVASYPGGTEHWLKYLTRHTVYPSRAYKNWIKGGPIVLFTVAPSGRLEDIIPYRSVEMSLDDEVVGVMEDAPKWTPAVYGNQKIRSYMRQQIVFDPKNLRHTYFNPVFIPILIFLH
jgi:hypothetical protein